MAFGIVSHILAFWETVPSLAFEKLLYGDGGFNSTIAYNGSQFVVSNAR